MSELSVKNVLFNLFISCKLYKLYDKLGTGESRQFISPQKRDWEQKTNSQLFASYDVSNRWVYVKGTGFDLRFVLPYILLLVFQKLQDGLIAPCLEAQKEENVKKNRYKNIFACMYTIQYWHILYLSTYLHVIFQAKCNMYKFSEKIEERWTHVYI